VGYKGSYENFGTENIMKELSGSVSLFLTTDKAPLNKSFECSITRWKIIQRDKR